MRRVATPLVFTEQASPATPPAGHVAVYPLASGSMNQKDDTGAETDLAAGGSGSVDELRVWGLL